MSHNTPEVPTDTNENVTKPENVENVALAIANIRFANTSRGLGLHLRIDEESYETD